MQFFLKIGVKHGKELSDFYPKQTRSYFSGTESLYKISSIQNRIKIAAVGVFTDRLTEWQNDRQTQVIL